MHICLEGLIYDSEHTLTGLLDKSGDYGLNPILAQFYTHHQSQIPDELLFFIFKHWHKVDSDSRIGLSVLTLRKTDSISESPYIVET